MESKGMWKVFSYSQCHGRVWMKFGCPIPTFPVIPREPREFLDWEDSKDNRDGLGSPEGLEQLELEGHGESQAHR